MQLTITDADAPFDGVTLDAHRGNFKVRGPSDDPRLSTVLRKCKAKHHEDGYWLVQRAHLFDLEDHLHKSGLKTRKTPAYGHLEFEIRHGAPRNLARKLKLLKDQKDVEFECPRLDRELRAHQRLGAKWLLDAGGGILADQPGSGKTITALSAALNNGGRTIILCPATAKHVWRMELEEHTEASFQVLQGRKRVPLEDVDFVIANYDILAAHVDALISAGFTNLLADEFHYCKDWKAKRTEAFVRLGLQIPFRVLISGTPMTKEASDLFPGLHVLRPADYPRLWDFQELYQQRRTIRLKRGGRFVEQVIHHGAKNLHELNLRYSSLMIRRKKRDLRADLPPKTRSTIYVDLPEKARKEYDAAEKDYVQYLLDKGREEEAMRAADHPELTRGHELLRLTLEAKYDAVCEKIDEALANDMKVLVFSNRLNILDRLQEDKRYADLHVRISGSTTEKQREDANRRFQTDDSVKVFLGQIRACAEAITLDAAEAVIFADPDWSPLRNLQAEDRAHRITTDHPVDIYHIVVKGTIEEHRWSVLQRKQADFDALIDGKFTESMDDPGSVVKETIEVLLEQSKLAV